MNAGKLRDRLTVYGSHRVQNDRGETDFVFGCLDNIPAMVTPTSGTAAGLPGDVERAEITHKIICRAGALPDLATDMYFLCRGRRLNVVYWLPIYSRPGWMEIYCKAVVERG